ncbi:hypothetical protein K227x_48130 [Rubripirellula lacrimiformis]|uniref:Uncharacterized protein n=1 Tax=Rubripirellula lacrimiformis TaxID=1930273 RepID=A0A517NGZ9_9BACT|nr:hypothetical protein [Rubripirellula lacrimiformis]QDT06404.1 hypothetical protein K227x_48130 [Rubripirellula lacrimiformis]
MIGALIAAGMVHWNASSHRTRGAIAPPATPVEPIVEAPKISAEEVASIRRAQFYDQQVEPQIAATDQLNRQAADRCVQRIERLVEGYHRGVSPFVDDLTSISTRLGIVGRMPAAWWNEDDRVHQYISQKFEKHLFSQTTLTDDIVGVLQQFRDEVDANQKRLLVDIQASLTTADLPDVNLDSYQPFFEKVARDLQDYSTRQGTSSVANGLTAILVSEAGSYVAISLIGGLLGRMAATGAATAAVGAGAAATGGAAGAGGGSAVGPAGTVIGAVIGLGVGLAIDWYMTDQFQVQLTRQMRGYIDSLSGTLLYGTPVASIDGQPMLGTASQDGGMVAALPIVCDDLRSAYRERFYQQIVQTEVSE